MRLNILLAIILFTLVVFPSSAISFQLKGEPVTEVTPGTTIHWEFILPGGESGSDYIIEVFGYRVDDEGIVVPVPAEQDTNIYSARPFISPGKQTVHVDAGETKTAEYIIKIPSNVGQGVRYALIRISTPPKGEGQVGIATAMQFPIQFTIKGSKFVFDGKITGIRIGDVVANQPIDIFTGFENTGNTRYNITNTVEVSDNSGELLGSASVTKKSPVPGTENEIKVAFSPESALPLGTYNVVSRISLDEGKILGKTTQTFEVTKPFVPPPPATSATIDPSRESILQTSDGRIQITFPAGAVSSSVKLSFVSLAKEAMPGVPQGAALGATLFHFDGIAGILAEEATLKVKYIDADLEATGGDPAKLALARWDEGKSAWQFYETELDEAQGTLTTKTDRLSVWAVMAVTDKSLLPRASLTWVVSVLALAIVFIGLDRKRRK